MSKDDREDQFHERKTRTRSPEETGGLAQSAGCKEGPLLGGSGFQVEGFGGLRLRNADLSPVLRGWGLSPIRKLLAQFAR